MKYLGDFAVARPIYLSFNTGDASGAPVTLAGGPAVRVYKDNSLTESAAGVTLSVDFDGRTGLHLVTIDTTADAAFYAAGSDFQIVLTVGTVSGISVAGLVLGTFSLANRAASPANLFTSVLTESYNADGVAPTLAQALFVILQRLTEFSISGTTITVKKLDGATAALTLGLDSATAPTSSTRAS